MHVNLYTWETIEPTIAYTIIEPTIKKNFLLSYYEPSKNPS